MVRTNKPPLEGVGGDSVPSLSAWKYHIHTHTICIYFIDFLQFYSIIFIEKSFIIFLLLKYYKNNMRC